MAAAAPRPEDDVVFCVERVHQRVVGHLRIAQAGKLGEKLIETDRLKYHQATRGAADRQIERMRHAGRNGTQAPGAAIQSPSV